MKEPSRKVTMISSPHVVGDNPELNAIVRRRFGRDHDKPCKNPNILTCAQWKCQVKDRCQWTDPNKH